MRHFSIRTFAGALAAALASAAQAAPKPQDAPSLVVRFAGVHEFGLRAEEALERINGRPDLPLNAQLRALAGGPDRARFLIDNRMSDEKRRELEAASPSELLHQSLVLEYPSVGAARAALNIIRRNPTVFGEAVQDRYANDWGMIPSDTHYNQTFIVPGSAVEGFTNQAVHALLGLHTAWDKVRGIANVAVLDTGIQAPVVNGVRTPHPDLESNVRLHLSRNTMDQDFDVNEPGLTTGAGTFFGHGTHVAGIVGARANNGIGVAGSCLDCSLLVMRITNTNGYTCASVTNAINEAVSNGAQVLNMSFGVDNACAGQMGTFDAAMQTAVDNRLATVTAAAGNAPDGVTQVHYPARSPRALSAAATLPNGTRSPVSVDTAGFPPGSKLDYAVPGERIFSTFFTGQNWNPAGWDAQGFPGTACVHQSAAVNAYGYCSGTSMAAPLLAGVVGVVRSADPLLSDAQVRAVLDTASNTFGQGANLVGRGVPNANTAVNSVTFSNKGVTPLFALYSPGLTNHLYTTVPQVASAAAWATLRHGGTTYPYSPYQAVSDQEASPVAYTYPQANTVAARAPIRVFTTITDNGTALVPMYRLSHSNGAHAIAVGDSQMYSFLSAGYVLDKTEGYVHPVSSPQPPGTVSVWRAYHSGNNDYALYKSDAGAHLASLGYGSHTKVGYACRPGPAGSACRGIVHKVLPVITHLILD